jgi:hypothetical protein
MNEKKRISGQKSADSGCGSGYGRVDTKSKEECEGMLAEMIAMVKGIGWNAPDLHPI